MEKIKTTETIYVRNLDRGELKDFTVYNQQQILLINNKPTLFNGPKESNLNLINKIYFPKFTIYPRNKVSTLTSELKRVVNPEKSDAVVLNKNNNILSVTKYFILFSQKDNTKKILNFDIYTSDFDQLKLKYQVKTNRAALIFKLDDVLSELKKQKLVSDDTIVLNQYVFTINYSSRNHMDYIDEIIKINNMKIIYDTTLDSFLAEGQPNLEYESALEIIKMIKSKDTTTINLGFKLWSTYDVVSRRKTSAAMLLFLNENNDAKQVLRQHSNLCSMILDDRINPCHITMHVVYSKSEASSSDDLELSLKITNEFIKWEIDKKSKELTNQLKIDKIKFIIDERA